MSKATITILCPSGHRRKVQMTPNSNLLQALEDMCNQEKLDSSEWGLIHQRKKCDLTVPWRLASIPTNALLEMYKLEERRPTSDVTVQLQIPDNSRYTGNFNPSITLQEMLDWYRNQSESMIAALDKSMNVDDKLYPVCSYMSEEIIGNYALSNTTLRELGLTSGAAVVRYNHRSITDDDLKKINNRIDEKIARRLRQQQQQQTTETLSVSSPMNISIPTSSPSITPATTTSFNNDEYSIFRDRPTTTSQQQPKTLAEALGINISFDTQPILKQPPQTDLSNFKFPEATKGQDLQQNESSDNFQRKRNAKLCDRHTIAYDLTSNSSTVTNQTDELPDSFFELTPDDLRSILNTLRQQSAEDNPLETRTMRGRVQSARANTYEYIAIRLVINSNIILQGLFYPEEPLSNLIEFARTNLICPQIEQSDFYLYTSPPRVVLSDLKKPLFAYDLAPASYVYIGHRTISPLIIQLTPDISIGNINEANQIVTKYVFNHTKSMNEDDNSNEISTTETNTTNRPSKRNPPTQNMDDKNLRDKFRKFLPGQK
ncbi:unnamed protein product [Rotaria sordida]|uniref:UBX domain-containing protein n=1 Tax=Rotaria sordida TaxID=392033 RepID=A0A814XL77_9BILA|nr:unnamed protein product [Rotaria sordida]CAF3680847.1 unnamed protein product [Rotaria sordida]